MTNLHSTTNRNKWNLDLIAVIALHRTVSHISLRTTEEIRVDVVFAGRRRNDLHIGVDGGRQSAPSVSDVERITKARPVESVLVHPVPLTAEEVRVVDVV